MMKTTSTISYFTCVLALLMCSNSHALTVRAIQSGDWESTATWQFGAIPTYGDSIVILPGKSVRVTSMLNYTSGAAMQLNIQGELTFQNGKKLTLPTGSTITIQIDGELNPGNGGGNSNTVTIGNTVVWNSGMGTLEGFLVLPASPLPIEMNEFRAVANDNIKVLISWQTIAEVNNAYFDIERGADGKQYKPIGRVEGHGTTSNGFKYTFRDDAPMNGENYYRLKQVDFDGKFVYTKSILFFHTSTASEELKLFPNPSKGEIFMDFPSYDGIIEVLIADSRGNRILEKQIQNIPGSRTTRITDPGTVLKPGVYFITCLVSEDLVRKQMIVY